MSPMGQNKQKAAPVFAFSLQTLDSGQPRAGKLLDLEGLPEEEGEERVWS